MPDTTKVRDQLAERAANGGTGGQELAPTGGPAQVTPAQLIRRTIERQSSAFKAVLPSIVDPERFSRLVLTAVKASPDLMKAFATEQGQTSVLLAAMQAAAIGLEPNTPTQDCWLLPRRNRDVLEAQLSIGYRGYLKLARRSGTIETIYAEVVHEADHFEWSRGLEKDHLEHRTADDEHAGELTHAYAVARYRGGGYSFIVLNRREIEARRALSDSWKNERSRPYSPWTKWPEAMWRKSAVRALVPFLDLSADVAAAVQHDEVPAGFTEEGDFTVLTTAFELEAAPEPEPQTATPPEGAEAPPADQADGETATLEGAAT